MPLQFSFDEMIAEVQNFKTLSREFLAPSAEQVFEAWLRQLQNARKAGDGECPRWNISEDRPLKTIPCTRAQNPRDRLIEGALTMIWQIEIPKGAKRRKGIGSQVFLLGGEASVRASLSQCGEGSAREIARWSFEIGDDQSPGCHFHTQVKGDETDRLFPPTLSIPRLPAIFVTPIDALDFVLGEVFQDAWQKHLGKETDHLRAWSNAQRMRMTKLLDWYGKEVKGARGAVWATLKRAKPNLHLLSPG